MLYPDVPTASIQQFNGAVTRLDPYQIQPSDGFLSLNCDYTRGEVSKRFGHSTTYTQGAGHAGASLSLDNWTFSINGTQVSALVYYVSSIGLILLNQIGPAFLTLIPTTGASGVSCTFDGERLYAAFYDSTGKIGTTGGNVYGWNIGGDPLFASPITNSPSMTNTVAAGTVTAGVHNFAYLITTRNGFTTMLCPSAGGIYGSASGFTPVAFTATGGHRIQMQITISPLPSYLQGGTIQAVMTTVANPNQYFAVPGATTIAFSGVNQIIFSIDDATLAATSTDVTNQLSLLTSGSGTPPFLPSCVFTYSGRMAYVTIDGSGFPVTYFSEPNDYQHITADQHGIYLEGRAQAIVGFSLRGVAYLCTQYSVYSIEDNGGVPVSWTPAQKVDGSIGVSAPNCVTVNPASGYAWVASERGLYLFQGGVFPPLPISYYRGNTDWASINWNAPTAVKVLDDQSNKRVMVIAPLNGSSVPNFILTWDYTEGSSSDAVKYSLNSFTNYAIGSFSNILNTTTQLREVWYAPGASGNFIRQNDGTEANPFRDVSTAGAPASYNWSYQTSLIPGAQDQASTIHGYHGMHLRATGNAALGIQVKSLDNTVSLTPAASPIQIAGAAGKLYLVQWYTFCEQVSLLLTNNVLDQSVTISEILAYYVNQEGMR
jgi:hypothetical protein